MAALNERLAASPPHGRIAGLHAQRDAVQRRWKRPVFSFNRPILLAEIGRSSACVMSATAWCSARLVHRGVLIEMMRLSWCRSGPGIPGRAACNSLIDVHRRKLFAQLHDLSSRWRTRRNCARFPRALFRRLFYWIRRNWPLAREALKKAGRARSHRGKPTMPDPPSTRRARTHRERVVSDDALGAAPSCSESTGTRALAA